MRAAVVVGCDGYGTANASLAGAVRDALAFWRWVCDPNGGGVTDDTSRRLLLSPSDKGLAVPADVVAGPADKASFEIALHEVVRDAGDERERLYVYFAGHGFSVDDDFTVQGAVAFADFDRNRTDNSIVVTELLSELSFSGFAEQILVFDACRNIPFEGRLRAGRISRPFDRMPGVTEQFCALATTALNRTSDGTTAGSEDASFSGWLMRALAGEGNAKIWNDEAGEYVVRWDQMFEFVTSALRGSVGADKVPRQLGERDAGDPVMSRFRPDAFPDVNLALRVHPDDVEVAHVVVHDPPDEHRIEWAAPGPVSVALVPRDYVVVASADGLEPERRRWQVAAYGDSMLDLTFVRPEHVRGVDRAPEPHELTVRAPDAALVVTVSLADGARLEALGSVVPVIAHATTVLARAVAPDGGEGPVIRRRAVPGEGEDLDVKTAPVPDAMRRFAERLELEVDADGLVDVGEETPAWPAASSLLAMAWARPTFVPSRVRPALPQPRSESLVVIHPDGDVVVHPPDAVMMRDSDRQPFGATGGRRLEVDGRELVVPNIPARALIIDLTGASPFVVPAPLTADSHAARRVDLGHRYAAIGRLRPAIDLLTSAGGDDDMARALAALIAERLDGTAGPTDDDALPTFTLGTRGAHPLLEHWAMAPRTSITLATAL